ncbi:hypothetical protein MMC13_005947 [Lambiella insularis]|nr:hypothetical protein [Lambiella insularis]
MVAEFHSPLVVRFRSQHFPLFTIYQQLAYIFSVTGAPPNTREARLGNYYLPYLAVFSQWLRMISPRPEYAPYVAAVAEFSGNKQDSRYALEFPFFVCSLMTDAGLEDPLARWTPEMETDQLDNYGSCAESLIWLLMKAEELPDTTGVALKTSLVNISTLDRIEISKRLMKPCGTCKWLAQSASCTNVLAHFGTASLKQELREG